MAETARRRAPQKAAVPAVTPPEQVRIVRRYLSTLDALRPGRGPKRAAEAVANRLLKIEELLISADPISRLHLTQERIDLDAEAIRLGNGNDADMAELEADFIKVAKHYGERCGVTFSAWRQVGVEADVLEKAGIVRVRKPGQNMPPAPAAKPPTAQPELKLEPPEPTPAVRRAEGAQKTQPPPTASKKTTAKKAAPAKKAKAAAKKA
jgi:hypothetical protein